LSPLTGHAFLERRYLIIPGLRSSRIYIVDTKPDPTSAKIHKVIEPEEVFKKTGYSRPHTVHCGPEGIYVSTLGGGGKDGIIGPPGVFIMDCETFDILGRWEIDRGPQNLHYDFWWNLPRDYMVTRFVLNSGRVVTGLVKQEFDKVVVVQTPTEEVRIQKSDIDTREQIRESLMPEGLLRDLTAQQAADLLEFLATRRSGGGCP